MSYAVKEIFMSIQGEGHRTGRAAVFIRFSGCNLWDGREETRARARCRFCDTDFVGVGPDGGRFESPEDLATAAHNAWTGGARRRYVVLTGGEPLLQVDDALLRALHHRYFEVAVETNGTIEAPRRIDWLTVSPKLGTQLVQSTGQELKVVYPQLGFKPEVYDQLPFAHFFVQPMDGEHRDEHTKAALAFCLENPKWRLSTQTHKYIGVR